MIDHKPDNNYQYDPSLMDTQRLLLGVQLPEDGAYDLDEILAEFSGKGMEAPPMPEEPAPPPEEPPAPAPEPPAAEVPFEPAPPASAPAQEAKPEPKPARKRFPWPARKPKPVPPDEPSAEIPPEEPPPREPEPSAGDDGELTEEDLLDLAFWSDGELPDAASAAIVSGAAEEPPPPAAQTLPPAPGHAPPPPKAPAEKTPPRRPAPEEPSMEAVVASTVDAVKVEQEKHAEQLRRRLEKFRRHEDRRPAKPKEPAARQPLPAAEREPPAAETAGRHKRQLRQCRRNLFPAVLTLVVLWLPWALAQSGRTVPFFSDSADNAALCVLVLQAILCILCWPVYRAAVSALAEGSWSIHATALLATVVTLLDEMTMLLLPERTDAAPLGGVAACLSVCALWGLKSWHKGMAETFRIAAMGEPTRVADHCPHGTAKGRGTIQGFYTRAMMEDTSSQWQRLLLPLLAVASLVFAGLASWGQDRPQDFLWCWSAVLCAASSPVFLLSYCVPFGRAASHLARDGAALAGMYGAAALSADPRLVVTDTDLFPAGSASLGGLKLYGEERERALSYAGSLASQGGGLLGRVFEKACQAALVIPQTPEHFHIHDDGGLSGMIRGETVLLGTPAFMRHQAVRLPPSLPSKLAVCLAVDGTLTAVFGIRYTAAEPVEYALRVLRRGGFRLTLASRDGNLTPRLLRARFGTDCGAQLLERDDWLALSAPDWTPDGPNGLLYRDNLLPFVSLVTSGRRLCQTARAGNLIAIFSSIAGALLAFYLTFAGSYAALTPLLVLTYQLLWIVPMLPLVWTIDKA